MSLIQANQGRQGDKNSLDIPRNRWGWPEVPRPSNPEQVVGCQRPSSFGKKVTDDYSIKQWLLRSVAKGAGMRPDLATMAATLDVKDDKDALQSIADQLKDAAGGAKGANMGTAIHTVLEKHLRGESYDVPPVVAGPVAAMLQRIERAKMQVVDGLIEPFVVCETIPAAGSPDAVVEFVDNADYPESYIFDLKTGSTSPIEFSSPLEYGVQMTIYANATHQWGGRGTQLQGLPPINNSVGWILWVPSDHPTGYAEFIKVDLEESWRMVDLAMQVTAARRQIKKRFVIGRDDDVVELGMLPPVERKERLDAAKDALMAAIDGHTESKEDIAGRWPEGLPSLQPSAITSHTQATVEAVEAWVQSIVDEAANLATQPIIAKQAS